MAKPEFENETLTKKRLLTDLSISGQRNLGRVH